MWTRVPLDPPHQCWLCMRGGHEAGPYWVGPRLDTGQAGPGGKIQARLHLCADCIFVAVNEPESPFHGLIPAGREALDMVDEAEQKAERLRVELDALKRTGGMPETVAAAAARAAVAEVQRLASEAA